ncbi:MAG TPA: DUF4375 domain-containing protein [Phycisphaerae bacterium]|nr:DUF4375 domain-containing protein [Phycisphaerae bacterium]HRR86453.1 DUF4375 domain-containing protein [Phycisphaerae bacterium]
MKHLFLLWLLLLGEVLVSGARAEGPLPRPATIFEDPADGGRNGEVQRMTDARIHDMVDDLLDWDSCTVAYRNLLAEGKDCVPHLLKALKDPRFHQGRRKSRGWQCPVNEIVELLIKFEPEIAARELKTLLNSPKGAIRRKAAFCLGRMATDECAEPVKNVLTGKDHELQVHATRGIAEAVSENRLSKAFGAAVFEPLVAILSADDEVSHEVPKCLMKIDATRAAGVLTNDKFLDPSSRLLEPVLEALEQGKVAVPTDKIIHLLGKLRAQAARYPNSREYALGLLILAHNRCPQTESLISQTLVWGDKETRLMAMRARCVWEGIPDPDAFVEKLNEERRLSELSDPQKKLVYVMNLEHHVGDDGFTDYFTCTCGRNAALAVSALREIGALRTARLLEKAMQEFGDKGPSRNTDVRKQQVSEMTDEQLENLDKLSERFRKDEDERRLLVLQFALKHKDHFRPAMTSKTATSGPAAKTPAAPATSQAGAESAPSG